MATSRNSPPHPLAAAIVPALVCGVFWWTAWPRARGWFPAPLDDVYIHFDFARSFATGGALEWIPGQGYSSGETAPLYAFVLAVGWLFGLRGKLLGVFAGFVAIAALTSLVRSVFRLLGPAPRWLAWCAALLPFAIAIVDWTLVSGMEVALLAGLLGRTLVALERAVAPLQRRGGMTRERAQWCVGGWGAALVLARPEAVVLVATVAVLAARGAGARSAFIALGRVALPGALAVGLVLGLNFVGTGDAASAGARLKLLSSNPYLSDVARARIFVENIVIFVWKGLRAELSTIPQLTWLAPALALASLLPRSPARSAGVACLGAAVGWMMLASWNSNSPHHNFRYYAPPILLMMIGASIGVVAIARSFGATTRGRRVGAAVSVLLALTVVGTAAPRFEWQVEHFARSVSNIRDQHVEMGLRLGAKTSPDARILVGDAGAIPFVSSRGAIDALGLGGFKRLPFTRAAVHGEAATLELLERLPPGERPTHLALYPNWFALTTERFGVELDRVTIERNTIAGGSAKVLYRADWSALDDGTSRPHPDALDEIDVADVISEREHQYRPPLPHGGWTTLEIWTEAAGKRRFDGGRIIPGGAEESFVVARGASPARLVVRIDPWAIDLTVTVRGEATAMTLGEAKQGAWREASVVLTSLSAGERLTLASTREFRDYHVWIEAAR